MNCRRNLVAVIAGCCLALGDGGAGPIAQAGAASGSSTATAPRQLTNAYPLGPKLCCGQHGSVQTATGQAGSAQTGSVQTGSAPTGSAPTGSARTGLRSSVAPGRTRRAATAPGGGASSGVSAVLVIGLGLGLGAVLLVARVAVVHRTRRRLGPVLADRSWGGAPVAHSNGTPAWSSLAQGRAARAGPFLDGALSPSATAAQGDELEYRRLDEDGDVCGAFNLGVVLHHRGDVVGAAAAYVRAEQRGDPDAAFNLGVLMYQFGDLDGAADSWQRSVGRGHVRAAANLVFLSRRRRQLDRGGAGDSDAGRDSIRRGSRTSKCWPIGRLIKPARVPASSTWV